VSEIEELRSSLVRALDEEESVREEAYSQCRDLIRSCRRTISDLVNGKEVDLSDLRVEASKVIEGTDGSGKRLLFVEDALAEYCEAEVLFSILSGEEIRTPYELGVSERAFVLGISDVVGELRRVTLNRLLRSDLQGAVSIYAKMEEIGQLVEGLARQFSHPFVDLSKVKVRGGEYIPGQLERTMDTDALVSGAVDEILSLCADRQKWLVFCSGVDHASHVRDVLRYPERAGGCRHRSLLSRPGIFYRRARG